MAKPAVFSAPRLSPDGKRLALLVLEGANQGISIYDEQRENVTRLTSSATVNDTRAVACADVPSSHSIGWVMLATGGNAANRRPAGRSR